jgi:DNA-binding response OmpR family regulator
MDIKSCRPSEMIRLQQDVIRQQDGIIELLKGALAALGCEYTPPAEPWVANLTPQERALLGALYARYPRAVDRYDLLEFLPGRGSDRQAQLVSIVVHKLRAKLGPDAVLTEHGMGYRMGAEFYASLKADEKAQEEERLAA